MFLDCCLTFYLIMLRVKVNNINFIRIVISNFDDNTPIKEGGLKNCLAGELNNIFVSEITPQLKVDGIQSMSQLLKFEIFADGSKMPRNSRWTLQAL